MATTNEEQGSEAVTTTTSHGTNESKQQHEQEHQRRERFQFVVGWIICLVSHILFGIQPILGRYLQKNGASHPIPTMNLIFASNVLVLVVYSPRLLYLLVRYVWRRCIRRGEMLVDEESGLSVDVDSRLDATLDDENSTVAAEGEEVKQQGAVATGTNKFSWLLRLSHRLRSTLDRYIFLIIFIVSRLLRTSTNVLSSKYTKAIYVQLFGLSTPFMVSAISIGIVNRYVPKAQREKWSIKSIVAMVITVLGGVMIIVGGAVNVTPDFKWYSFLTNVTIDWSRFWRDFGFYDIVGMVLSLLASLCLSIYMISARFMNQSPSPSSTPSSSSTTTATAAATVPRRVQLSEEYQFLFQLVALSLMALLPSFLLEDWTVWLKLTPKDWSIFVLFSLCNYLAANFLMLYAVRAIGASSTGSVLALRLISTISFSGVVLGEWFVSVWQLVGSCIVISSISYYLYTQNAIQKASSKQQQTRTRRLTRKSGEQQQQQQERVPLQQEPTD